MTKPVEFLASEQAGKVQPSKWATQNDLCFSQDPIASFLKNLKIMVTPNDLLEMINLEIT